MNWWKKYRKSQQFKNVILFLAVMAIAASLRLYNLNLVPPSLSHDEVAIAYNAYSIMTTGRDEYGQRFPILFRSYDDYKLPAMVYATIPSIYLFGLNEWGVRIPSAVFGILTVAIFYLLCREWFRYDRSLSKNSDFQYAPHLISLFLAISPWHINFSRQSFESNGAVLFLVAGTYGLFVFQRNRKGLIITVLSWAVALYFYYSVRVIIPFLTITFIIINRKQLIKNLKLVILCFIIGLIMLWPILPKLVSAEGLARIKMVSVTNDAWYLATQTDFSRRIAANPTFISKIIFNRRLVLITSMARNYLLNIEPRHVFLTGTVNMGLQYPWELPLILVGLVYLLRRRNKNDCLILTWLLVTPLIGALSTNQPNALRTLPNAPPFAFLAGLGCIRVMMHLEDKKRLFMAILAVVILLSVRQFADTYFIYTPRTNARSFADGNKQMVAYVKSIYSGYDRIFISGYMWRPYIFVLFYWPFPPQLYQNGGQRDAFANFLFGKASWDNSGLDLESGSFDIKSLKHGRTLLILSPAEFDRFKSNLQQITTINGRFTENVYIAAEFKD